MTKIMFTEGYSKSSAGKIHWHRWEPDTADQSPADLLLLHPMPHSGLFFETIAPLLAEGRAVIAPDYPGYGSSDSFDGIPTIGAYAESMIEVLRSRDGNRPVDLFGFHTGCLVAVEMSLSYPDEVRRIVQVDVPYFDPAKRKELMASDFAVGGFIAAFSYAGEERYPHIDHDCLVIATASSLLEPSRAAAKVIPGCHFEQMPDVNQPALENGAVAITRSTLAFLDQ